MPEHRRSRLTGGLTREDQLCLLLSRGQLNSDEQAHAREFLTSPVQWPLLFEHAYAHQVYPLVYRNLRTLEFLDVPDAVQAELKGAFLANALHNQLLAEELARLLGLLAEAGIPVIPLKGVTLAQALYGDTYSRVCSDIDILVRPANVTQALDLILASGYRDDYRDRFFSRLALRHGRHYNLCGDSFPLELHWQLVQHCSRNDEIISDLWAEARPKTFFGAPALSLSPEWELLYLSIHAADHGWQSLKWLSDIHQIVSFAPLDWPKVAQKAERLELDLTIRQTLTASSLLLGTPLPSGCSPTPLPAGVRVFPHVPLSPEAAFSHLRVLVRPLDRLRCMTNVVLVPKQADQDFLQLPAPLSFLHYAVRPARLVVKWFLRLTTYVLQDRPVNGGQQREVVRECQTVDDVQRSDSA